MLSRRDALFALFAQGVASASTPARSAGAPVAIIMGDSSPPYLEASAVLMRHLEQQRCEAVLLNVERDRVLIQSAIQAAHAPVAVAIGPRAYEVLTDGRLPAPIVACLVPEGNRFRLPRGAGAITLQVSPSQMLRRMQATLPLIRRIGVIAPRSLPFTLEELQVAAARHFFTVKIVNCEEPKEVLEAVAGFRNLVDAIWCLPDPHLFPRAAISPLVLSSIRNRVPLIGFSEGFANAGALAAVFPDYAETGNQTAEMVLAYLKTRDGLRKEYPRKVRVAVNEQIAKILRLDVRHSAAKGYE